MDNSIILPAFNQPPSQLQLKIVNSNPDIDIYCNFPFVFYFYLFQAAQITNSRGWMYEQKLDNLFKESTDMFCQANYPACLALLSDCIELMGGRSFLYSNRAIAKFHLKNINDSFEDLQTAIHINHQNYVAYFNIFSLHFLNSNNQQSFRNLCLCLSSAYTTLYRLQNSQEWLKNSLHYSYNNKQSIFLKAVQVYQKNELRGCLELLNNVLSLENEPNNWRRIQKLVKIIQERLKITARAEYQQTNLCQYYELQTQIPYPGDDLYDYHLQQMLKQFNKVYKMINDEMQISKAEYLEQEESSLHTQGTNEKINNKRTAYNSIALPDQSRNTENQDQRSHAMMLSHNKELKLLSVIRENSFDHYAKPGRSYFTSFTQGHLYPIGSVPKKVKFFIERAQMSLCQAHNIQVIYALISYLTQQGQKFKHRTSVIPYDHINLIWSQWTQALQITKIPSPVSVKILSKNYTRFKDDLLAEGILQVGKSIPMKIPLFHKDQCKGVITITAVQTN